MSRRDPVQVLGKKLNGEISSYKTINLTFCLCRDHKDVLAINKGQEGQFGHKFKTLNGSKGGNVSV